jgi:predicted extracellular nuclease
MQHISFSWLSIVVLLACVGCNPSAEKATNKQTQAKPADQSQVLPSDKKLSVGFYNVENLFDTQDDPQTQDDDFTPTGEMKWTEENYSTKLSNLAKVISSLDVDILGLSEVENREVLEDLIQEPSLRGKAYKIVHEHSRDGRGIDVALLYPENSFLYQSHESLRPSFSFEPGYRSRDVLRVSGLTADGEVLHLYVNHWPSRRGGREESEPRRLVLARLVKASLDKIRQQSPDAHFLLMGDFNDDPHNKGIMEILDAKADPAQLPNDGLYNPMRLLHNPDSYGSLTYRGKWNLFDQFLVSEDLVSGNSSLDYVSGSAEVYHPEWMRVGYGRSAEAPRRAIFRGEFREDGFSDHFPIRLQLVVD